MIILPAIDILSGEVVRLKKGDYSESKRYDKDPVSVAIRFEEQNAEMLHIVDLDGAREGSAKNIAVIEKMAKRLDIPIQVGGGIRDIETIYRYFDIGVARVILGTAAIKDPGFALSASDLFPDRIYISLDMKDEKVATSGWLDSSDESGLDLGMRFEDIGIAGLVVTDISRDGMLTGPNISLLEKFAKNLSVNIIASGGISSIDDLKKLIDLKASNIEAVIIGKAIYENKVSLLDAISLTKMI